MCFLSAVRKKRGKDGIEGRNGGQKVLWGAHTQTHTLFFSSSALKWIPLLASCKFLFLRGGCFFGCGPHLLASCWMFGTRKEEECEELRVKENAHTSREELIAVGRERLQVYEYAWWTGGGGEKEISDEEEGNSTEKRKKSKRKEEETGNEGQTKGVKHKRGMKGRDGRTGLWMDGLMGGWARARCQSQDGTFGRRKKKRKTDAGRCRRKSPKLSIHQEFMELPSPNATLNYSHPLNFI